MANAYHYQHTFKDEMAQEFRQILSMPFEPQHFAGLKLWLDGSDLSRLTVDGNGKVSQWDDKSDNGHHAVQATSTVQPISGQEVLDGKNGIFFDYLAKHIMTSGYQPQASDSLTSFIVARRVDDSTVYGGGSAYKVLLSSGRPDTSSVEVGKFNVAENRDTARLQTISHKTNAYNSPNGVMMDGRTHIISSRLDLQGSPNHVAGRADGLEEEFDDMPSPPVADEVLPFEIGGSSSASTRRFWGTIFEVLIYDQPLSDTDILTVELYLAEKWHCYHPQAAWILEYDAVTQAAIHASKLSRDDITTSASPLILWLDANDTTTITMDGSNLVSQWDDKSPRSFHHTCSVTVQQPDYVTAGLNSKPAIVFEGAENALNEYLQIASGFPQLTSFTMFIVNSHDALNVANSHICYEIGNQVLFRWEAANSSLAFRTRDSLNWEPTANVGVYAIQTPKLITASYDLTELSFSLNSGTPVTVAKTEAIDTGAGWARLNRMGTGGAGEQSVGEIIIFNRPLDATQIANIQAYLTEKWSIT